MRKTEPKTGWGIGLSLGLWLTMMVSAPWLAAQNVSEQYLLAAANQDRMMRNLPPLRINPQLQAAARWHAYEMARRRGISHQFPGEPELASRAADAGAHFSLVSENVAEAPNSALIHELWMKSEGHRANLLDPKVDSVGIAVVQRDGQLYAVEDFARTVQRISLEQQEFEVGGLLARRGLRLIGDAREARETCLMATGYAGARQPWFVMRYTSSDIDRLPEELTARLEDGRYREAAVGACSTGKEGPFTGYSLAVLLYP